MKAISALRISARVLDEARLFFEEKGAYGFEGTAMLVGVSGKSVNRCIIPDQRPYGGRDGVAVEVTPKGKLQLAACLALDERFVARIHSHPGEAFHSSIDDQNPGLTAIDSLSIVVPFYGLGLRRGLEACAIFIYKDRIWKQIQSEMLSNYVRVTK